LKNPKATIEKEFGLKVHEELIVFENSENVTHIVIPLLSTEELKQLPEKYEKSQNLEENIYWVLIKCLKDSDFKKAFMQN
ncbi:hypothetical protein, partial [Salmonella sp. SAL4446]|uniref:hypothetical protein n=1 Tax=Salmonella sp. SAL4446 TaxID=3159901 RepID=UPI00397C6841